MGDAEDDTSNGSESDLAFYFRFVKPLILNLAKSRDRALAAAWARKIVSDDSGTEKLRTDYLKLLLMALQRSHLVGIFADDPDKYDRLDEFPAELDLNDFAKELIEKELLDRQERIKEQLKGDVGDFPPYMTDCSIDMQEYVAVQDIPGFGVHCYYAISKEPIDKWHNAEKGIFPNKPKSAGDFSEPSSTIKSSTVQCVCAPNEEEEESECAKRMQPEPAKKMRSKKWGVSPPIHPIGASPVKDDRIPPIWGSNLINVLDEKQSDSESEEELLSLSAELSNLQQFLDQYSTGTLSKKASISTSKTSQLLKKQGKAGEDSGEGDSDEDKPSQRMAEVQDDSHLVEYFKGKLRQTADHYQTTRRNQEVQASTPARVYIPVTTPKQSPIPKRPTTTSRGSGTEKTCRSFSSNFNNDIEGAQVNKELAMWMGRVKEFERECVATGTQTTKPCGAPGCNK